MSYGGRKILNKAFIGMLIYSIYKAIYKKLGDETWDVVWESGKIFYSILKKEIGIDDRDPPQKIISKISEFFKEAGFLKNVDVLQVDEDVIEFTIYSPITWNGTVKLREEGMVPGQVLIPVLVAALEAKGYKVTRLKEREYGEKLVVERWKIIKPRK
jgi:hypothetical protein